VIQIADIARWILGSFATVDEVEQGLKKVVVRSWTTGMIKVSILMCYNPPVMRHLLTWMFIYTLVMALGQIFLKMGMSKMAGFSLQSTKDAFLILPGLLRSPYILLGAGLMAASFVLWLFILSWFRLSLVFPLTALTFVFVVLLSYFMLGEKMLIQNYAGIVLIAFGIFFLLYK